MLLSTADEFILDNLVNDMNDSLMYYVFAFMLFLGLIGLFVILIKAFFKFMKIASESNKAIKYPWIRLILTMVVFFLIFKLGIYLYKNFDGVVMYIKANWQYKN